MTAVPFLPLGDMLRKRAARAPFRRELLAAALVRAARSWIAREFGEDSAAKIRACYLREGVFHLGVGSAPFAAALRVREEDLRRVLKEAAPRARIRSLRIFVGG